MLQCCAGEKVDVDIVRRQYPQTQGKQSTHLDALKRTRKQDLHKSESIVGLGPCIEKAITNNCFYLYA